MSTCLISIGSNLGDTAGQVTACLSLLQQHSQIAVSAVSTPINTQPVGGPADQEPFLNAVVKVETQLAPEELLHELREIENRLGRVREVRWEARVIDLDLLLFDELVLRTDSLELPHPRMAFRRFVIEPANEIAGEMLHPVIGWTVSQLAAHLDLAAEYVALTGIPGTGKTAIMQAVAERIPVRTLVGQVAATEKATIKQRQETLATIQKRQKSGQNSIVHSTRSTGSWEMTPDPFFISDFWFEQSAAYIECLPDLKLQAELMLTFDNLLSRVPRPKLLVVLERSLPDGNGLARLQQRIVERSRISGRGPTLWLDADEFSLAVDEIVAAIEAMG